MTFSFGVESGPLSPLTGTPVLDSGRGPPPPRLLAKHEFLAVAILLVGAYDEALMQRADAEARAAWNPVEREAWEAWRDEDMVRLGARRVLWLEAQPR